MKKSHSVIKAKQKASQLLQANRLADAWDVYERISRQAPGDHEVWLNMGAIAARQGQFERAESALRRALTLRPDLPQANVNLARLLLMKQRLEEALPYLKKYLTLQPQDVDGYYQLGSLLEALKNPSAAEEVYRQALPLARKSVAIHIGLARLLRLKGEYAAASAQCDLTLQLKPDAALAYFELGQIHREQHRFDEALSCFERLIALAPNERENYLLNLGLLHVEQGRYDEALANYRALIEFNPKSVYAHWNYSLLLLLTGNFKAGWAEYEWRRQTHFWQGQMWQGEFAPPRWAGEPLVGRTLLIYAEQGFGDTIQFVRYLPLLQAQGARVIFHCQPSLLGLFQRIPGLEVEPRNFDKAQQTGFDYHLPLMSLPHLLGTTVATIPATLAYLKADPERVAAWRARIDPCRFNVGLAWAGSITNPKDRWRSVSLAQLAPLAEMSGVTFYGLQKEGVTAEQKPFADKMNLIDLASELHDFDDTAAVIENLDLVISIDSVVAHLVGALAKPVWTLIYFPVEWRWLLGRADSPWYPTMRLFRQNGADPQWPAVIDDVVAALRHELIAGKQPR